MRPTRTTELLYPATKAQLVPGEQLLASPAHEVEHGTSGFIRTSGLPLTYGTRWPQGHGERLCGHQMSFLILPTDSEAFVPLSSYSNSTSRPCLWVIQRTIKSIGYVNLIGFLLVRKVTD